MGELFVYPSLYNKYCCLIICFLTLSIIPGPKSVRGYWSVRYQWLTHKVWVPGLWSVDTFQVWSPYTGPPIVCPGPALVRVSGRWYSSERESSQWSGSHPVWPVHLSPEKKTQLKTFLHAWQSEKLLWNNQAYLTYLTVQYAWSIDCGRTRAGPRVDSWGLALFTHHSSDCIREILIAGETL